MVFSRIILAFTGCIFAVYGLMCLVDPATPAGYAGMELAQASASTEVIAMYGGLQIGLGALLVAWAWRPHLVVPALVVTLFCVGGLALGRASGLMRNGVDAYNLGVDIPLRTGGTVRVELPANRNETNNAFAVLNPSFDTTARFSISQPLLRNAGVEVNEYSIRIASYENDIANANTKLETIRILAAADKVCLFHLAKPCDRFVHFFTHLFIS